jgi:phosphoribosylamine--glycine ligase/phosphoribosylformylglycinamidine cyclo-ligase
MSLRILLLGSGGREHALVWKLARSPLLDHIYVCPGNAGTQLEPKTSNIIDISPNDFPQLVDFAVLHEVSHFFFQFDTIYRSKICKVGLVVPGPEQPLVDGVEAFFRNGLNVLDIFR